MKFKHLQIVGSTGFEGSEAARRIVHLSHAMYIGVFGSGVDAPFAKLVVRFVNATKGYPIVRVFSQHQSIRSVSVLVREEDLPTEYDVFRETVFDATVRGANAAESPVPVVSLIEKVCADLRNKPFPMRFVMETLRLPKSQGGLHLVYEVDETSARVFLIHDGPLGVVREKQIASSRTPALMPVFFPAKKLAHRDGAAVVLGVEGQPIAQMKIA